MNYNQNNINEYSVWPIMPLTDSNKMILEIYLQTTRTSRPAPIKHDYHIKKGIATPNIMLNVDKMSNIALTIMFLLVKQNTDRMIHESE